jgi:hypothetical protein
MAWSEISPKSNLDEDRLAVGESFLAALILLKTAGPYMEVIS